MTVTVNGPNGVTINFPDGTDYDTINRVMTQHTEPAARMPTFETTGPDGATYHINAPDEHRAVEAFSAFIKGSLPAPTNDDSTTGDVAKSAGVGLVKGGIGLAGLPGDLSNALAHGSKIAGDYIAGKLGFDPSPDLGLPALPTSGVIQKGVESATGPLYEPKTTAGQYAETAGEFLPAAIGGPESLATRLATRVAAPAVASETAGQLTKGTAAEPYARLAGAIAGGTSASAGVNKFLEMIAANKAAAAVPSAEALKDAARAGYDHPDVAAVQIKPQAASDLATKIENDLVAQGFRARPGQGGSTFDTIAELKNAPGPVSVQDIDSVRKALGNVGKSGIPTADSVAANKAIAHLDDFLPNLSQSDLIAGDAAAANQILQDARGNWAAAKRSNMLTDKIDAAELQAASANSGHNVENALRQRMRSVLTSPKLSRGLSVDEKSAIEAFVRGGPVSNVVRHIGNYLGGGGGPTVPFTGSSKSCCANATATREVSAPAVGRDPLQHDCTGAFSATELNSTGSLSRRESRVLGRPVPIDIGRADCENYH